MTPLRLLLFILAVSTPGLACPGTDGWPEDPLKLHKSWTHSYRVVLYKRIEDALIELVYIDSALDTIRSGVEHQSYSGDPYATSGDFARDVMEIQSKWRKTLFKLVESVNLLESDIAYYLED